jgi:membrane-associated protease RseP (regulator of RpoE activity)
MFSAMRRGASLPLTVLALALAAWIVTGPKAFAHGGGGGGGHGGGGGGHGGGGHSGGGHHGGGGYHGGGYHHGGSYYHGHGGYYGGYYPGFYFGSGYYGYPGYGYGYGYGYGTGYGYPSYNSGYYPAYTYDSSVYAAAAPSQGRYLGIDEQAVVESAGPGMKVLRVYPGSPAEQAGLQPGDLIQSANGYLTQQHGNLTWIISTVPANGVLQMNVRKASDGAAHSVSAQLP